MNLNSMLVVGKEGDGKWKAMFGSFHEDEAPDLADSIDKLFDQCGIPQLELTAWDTSVEAVVKCLYEKGFVFAENRDGHGNVVQRAVYKKREAESRF